MTTEVKNTYKVHSVQSRVKFLASLTYNPKFYRIISDILSDPTKLDTTLGTLCYFSLFLGAVIKRYPNAKIPFLAYFVTSINKLLAFLSRKIYGEDKKKPLISVPIEGPPINSVEKDEIKKNQLERISKVLNDFSGYITDIRIFNRGFTIPAGIADIIEAKSLLKDKDYLNYISTWCISLYQPIETLAFLFDHNWLLPNKEDKNVNYWYALSTRFWFVWVVAEFVQVAHKILVVNRCKKFDKSELIAFIEHLATLPLCYHWSLEDGWLDDLNVGFFGTIAGGLTTYTIWNEVWNTILSNC